MRIIVVVAVALLVAACQQSTPSRQPAATSSQTPVSGQNSSNPNKTNPYVVLGKRYVPIKNAEGYRERGVASWYGPNFHGKPTANGEVFDMDQLTAAHKTLPLPVYAEVTNLRNGRRVVVRINDRGPFVDNRLIDMSRAAAQALDMVGPGTTLVDVRVIPGPGAGVVTPAPEPTPSQASAFFVQVGAFGDAANANRVAASLNGAGFADVLIEPLARAEGTLHRVRVGPVASVNQFDDYIARLTALGYREARLAVD
ncbi:MAG: septal ring lytic transglycosylase RlpA family protein [Gammaproteobacteria bacterium]